MPGDEWQRFANLRLLYGYMFTHPGTKLIFQGGEFGQSEEWNFQQSLDWHLLEYDYHKGIKETVTALNTLYKTQPAMYEKQFSPEGFEWIEHNDAANSVLTYLRKGNKPKDTLVVVINFTPVPRYNYKIGVPETIFAKGKKVKQVFNSNESKFGGSGDHVIKEVTIDESAWNGRSHSITLDIPALSVIVFRLNNNRVWAFFCSIW